MSDTEDAASFSSFADAKSHDSETEDATHEESNLDAAHAPTTLAAPEVDAAAASLQTLETTVPGMIGIAAALDAERGDAADRAADATADGTADGAADVPLAEEREYDESLPDGRSFRRRRRSVLEVEELPDDQRDLDASLAFKSEGNRHFGLGDHNTAAACYTECLRHLPRGAASDGQAAVGYANRAACHLMCGRLEETVYDCDRALEFNSGYAKALARRATALEKLGKLEEASKGESSEIAAARPVCQRDAAGPARTHQLLTCPLCRVLLLDLGRLLEMEPANRTARDSIARIEAACKERDEKLKEEMVRCGLKE